MRSYLTDIPGVPPATSPISHAVVVGNTCHISGQLSTFSQGYQAGTAREEASRAFELVFTIAEYAGFQRHEIAYLDIAFSDLDNDLAEVNHLISQLFTDYPARTIYEAKQLPFHAKIKIQAIALKD